MNHSSQPRPASGFTLVEMLIALTIFAMLTAAGVALLSVTARTQQSADRRLDQLGELRVIQALMSADFAQAVARRHRDRSGIVLPAFSASPDGRPFLLDFVRSGVEAEIEGRSNLQRVEYRLSEDRFERLTYPMVDGASAPVVVVLLRGVQQLRLRYRDEEGSWNESWLPSDGSRLPRAVELVIDAEPYGLVRQLFLVGAAL